MKKLVTEKKENGAICRKERKKLWVALDIECNDKSSKKKGCSGGCISCAKREIVRKSFIPVDDSSVFSLGQKVTISHFIPDPAIMGFVVFGIPVVLALFTISAWFYFAPHKAETSIAVLSTCLAFVGGFLILKLLDLLFRHNFPSTLLHAENHSQQDH